MLYLRNAKNNIIMTEEERKYRQRRSAYYFIKRLSKNMQLLENLKLITKKEKEQLEKIQAESLTKWIKEYNVIIEKNENI